VREATASDRGLRISVVVATLGGGGTERLVTQTCAGLARLGHDVTLTTLTELVAEHYAVDEVVHRDCAAIFDLPRNGTQALRVHARRLRTLRETLRRQAPDVIISFIDTTNVRVLVAAHTIAPVIVVEETDPAAKPINRRWRLLRRLLYPRASIVVVHAEAFRAWASRTVRDPARVRVIPNAVWLDGLTPTDARSHTVLAIGRLVAGKGLDVLVRAFAAALVHQPGWVLKIYGEGEEQDATSRLISELGIEDSARLMGWTDDPAEAYRTASIFVLPSTRESFPLVLVEAMASGLAVVATRIPGGPSEVIADGENGFLVTPGRVEDLGQILERLMESPETRTRVGAAARASAAQFTPDAVLRLWESAILEASAQGSRTLP